MASRGGEEARRAARGGDRGARRPRGLGRAGRARRGGHPADAAPAQRHRDVVDGNDDPEHAAPPDWEALARLGGTLVILTGRGRIRRIAAKLIDGGLAPDTPIAAISAASREAQRVLRGTLAALPAPLPPPVTFVVGAALRRARSLGAHPRRLPERRGRRARRRRGRHGARGVRAARGRRGPRARPPASPGWPAPFFLVGDAPMVPIAVGTQGHLLGGTLAVALLGPWLGAMTIAVVCAVQALVLGDGGITTLGLNDRRPRARARVRRLPAAARAATPVAHHDGGLATACGLAAAVDVLLAAGIFVRDVRARRRGPDRPARAGRQHARRLRRDRGDRGRHHRAHRPRAARGPARPRAVRPLRREAAPRSRRAGRRR